MTVVFMSDLERKVNNDHVETAQVLIQEDNGIWEVIWIEKKNVNNEVCEHWFEGRSWDEMLNVFRYRLAEKLATGFVPKLEPVFKQ